MREISRRNKGFTLIELVVVIAILGILASTAIMYLVDVRASARGNQVVADLQSIDSAIKLYESMVGVPPTSLEQVTKEDSASSDDAKRSFKLLDEFPAFDGSPFIVTQKDGKEVTYEDVTKGAKYRIVAGRATLGGDAKTADWYLGNRSAVIDLTSIAAYVQTIKDTLQKINTNSIDSGAAGVEGSFATTAVQELAAEGVNLAELGATTWHWEKNTGILYWTPVNLEEAYQNGTVSAGDKIPVIRYNTKTGTYTVWMAKVDYKTNASTGSVIQSFAYISTAGVSGYAPSTSQPSSEQTIENAVEKYNQAVEAMK